MNGEDVYSLEKEVSRFFEQTSASRADCETYVIQHVGKEPVAVPIQGICSYTMYSGSQGEVVVQFRLKSLQLNMETMALARSIYGDLVPQVTFKGEIGEDVPGKDPLCVYVMKRIPGLTYLEFLLKHGHSTENSPTFFAWRKTLNQDMVNQIVQKCIESIPEILSLPLVVSNQPRRVVGWAEATVEPFGIQFHIPQLIMGHVHLKDGLATYDDFIGSEKLFWDMLSQQIGLDNKTTKTVQLARIMGTLLSHGFTSRLANMPAPRPISKHQNGGYNMRLLDGLLIDPSTRYPDLSQME